MWAWVSTTEMKHIPISRRQLLRTSGVWSVSSCALLGLNAQAGVLLELEQAQRLLWSQASNFQAVSLSLGERELSSIAQLSESCVQANWRRQFNGRKKPQSMRFADDIKNISGATLSCQHVTEGVQRLSALLEVMKWTS